MDVKTYIDSGILEQYILGDVSDQERREVECLSSIYPEIREALDELETGVERLANLGSIKPPSNLRGRILDEVSRHEPFSEKEAMEKNPENALKRAAREPETPKKRSARPILWAAATIAMVFAIWQYSMRVTMENQITKGEEERRELLSENRNLEGRIDRLTGDVEDAFDPKVRKVVLKPTREKDVDDLTLFWQRDEGRIKINLTSLPNLPEENQYQLWVLIDGKPSNMGVLPKDFDDIYESVESTLEGDAFAITVEPFGGRENPSLDQLVYLGEV